MIQLDPRCQPDASMGALPGWLSSIVNKVVRGTTVTVPTPAGPVVVDLGNKASVDAARAALTGARISTSVANRPASPFQDVNATVQEKVPGGWFTIAAAGAFALFVLPKLLGGRRR